MQRELKTIPSNSPFSQGAFALLQSQESEQQETGDDHSSGNQSAHVPEAALLFSSCIPMGKHRSHHLTLHVKTKQKSIYLSTLQGCIKGPLGGRSWLSTVNEKILSTHKTKLESTTKENSSA